MKTRFLSAITLILALASAAQAIELPPILVADPGAAAQHQAAPAPKDVAPDNPLQAICREILVNIDEGYGVSNQESRVICDEPR